jgi:DNA-binding beta-propeller fold protein YncE
MKKLLLVLVPLVLSAQVEVDTVVRLPASRLGQGFFVPEFNKLYIMPHYGDSVLFVLDCSTYCLSAQILVGWTGGRSHFSWNSRRQKLYITTNPGPDSTLAIDVAADSILGWLTVHREVHTDAYLGDVDRRYKPAVDTLYEYDCAADTVIRRLPIHSTCASWDSVGQKLYVGEGSRKKLYVYDYIADSCIKEIDVSAVSTDMPDAVIFNHNNHHRGYVGRFAGGPFSGNVGIIDTERDTLLRTLAVRIWNGLYSQVAVNERDGKVYIADSDARSTTPDTMWVVDCATDSILKKFECVPRGHAYQCTRWVPWSNRIYLVNIYPDGIHNSSLVVIDCNTDSVIVPGLFLGDNANAYIQDIVLDPVHERVFVIGGRDSAIYVLRDTGYAGVLETGRTEPRTATSLQLQMTPGGYDVRYSLASPSSVDLSVYDLMGREVRPLVDGQLPAGQHRALWDCRDSNGTLVPRGVYFCRLAAGSASTAEPTAVAKVVVTR